jgi:hypothetical protein
VQLREAFLHELFANSLSMMRWRDRQVINQAAAAIVSAKHGADDRAVFVRNAAKAWVAQEVSADFLFGIAFGYFHPFHHIPKRHRLIIIIDDEFPGVDRRHIFALEAREIQVEMQARAVFRANKSNTSTSTITSVIKPCQGFTTR